ARSTCSRRCRWSTARTSACPSRTWEWRRASSPSSRRACSAADRRPHAILAPMSEEKLRLGGMALRNGLLVHGPTHWAAAVRTSDGQIKVASGPKPRLAPRALERVPGVRGVAKLAEAMAVIPLVKRDLPEAKLPMQDMRT